MSSPSVWLVFLSSMSLAWTEPTETKLTTKEEKAVAYSLNENNDGVNLIVDGEKSTFFIPKKAIEKIEILNPKDKEVRIFLRNDSKRKDVSGKAPGLRFFKKEGEIWKEVPWETGSFEVSKETTPPKVEPRQEQPEITAVAPASVEQEVAKAEVQIEPSLRAPFAKLPLVTPLEKMDSACTGKESSLSCLEKLALEKKGSFFVHRFNGPAHFPMPRFGDAGEPVCAEGVIIYEGMQLLALPDGRYEIQFTASAPSIPVTLRLQVLVSLKEREPILLTLPAVSLSPESNSQESLVLRTGTVRENNDQQVYRLRHEGYAHQFIGSFSALSLATVSRKGVARFGSLPTRD